MLLAGAVRFVLLTLRRDDDEEDILAWVSCWVRHIAFDDDDEGRVVWFGEECSMCSALLRGDSLRDEDSDSLLSSTSACSLENSGERDLVDTLLVVVAASDVEESIADILRTVTRLQMCRFDVIGLGTRLLFLIAFMQRLCTIYCMNDIELDAVPFHVRMDTACFCFAGSEMKSFIFILNEQRIAA